MKIAMIGHKRVPSREGGVEIVVEEISTRLVKMGHQVDIYNRKGKNVQDKKVFTKDGEVYWQCRNCGHIYKGTEAPQVCPVCNHERSYFQVKCESYK